MRNRLLHFQWWKLRWSIILSLIWDYPQVLLFFRPVFFNLGSAEPRSSTHHSLGSVRIIKLALFWVSKFCQLLNNFSKVPRLQKGWKPLLQTLKIDTSSGLFNNRNDVLFLKILRNYTFVVWMPVIWNPISYSLFFVSFAILAVRVNNYWPFWADRLFWEFWTAF